MRKTIIISIALSILIVAIFDWVYWTMTPSLEPATTAENKIPIRVQQRPPTQEETIQKPIAMPDVGEDEALDKAEKLAQAERLDSYKELRSSWYGKERQIPHWCFLDAEVCVKEGRMDEAIKILSSKEFSSQQETERLVRLAALHLVEDPRKAQNYLAEALTKDSKNSDLHTYKAALFESSDDFGKAESEYIRAVQKNPDNLFLREQLADFYIRLKHYPEALQVLQDAFTAPSLDSIGLKLLFWNRMLGPDKAWQIPEIAPGSLSPLLIYLNSLPLGTFWNGSAFQSIHQHEAYLASRQETFWLRLFDALKRGDETEASDLLHQNPFRQDSWQPELERDLAAVITYRALADPDLAFDPATSFTKLTKERYLDDIATLSTNLLKQENLVLTHHHQLLTHQDSLAMLLLVYGWKEAALQLYSFSPIPSRFPSWMVQELTLALKENRGAKAALDFALGQPFSPALSLLVAQIAMEAEQAPIALNALLSLYKGSYQESLPAALILANLFFMQEDFKAAKDALNAQPELSRLVPGKELLARIAVKEGASAKAEELYMSIEENSDEAKSFLLQKAFREEDWKQARKLTEALLASHPGNAALQEVLKKNP